ncbi:MAG: hypothetical protein GFH27_549293n261 [Chloroflexi bacterium AL-W]|nr:hypothetical protein [Chloroflexi bacterium AL-N1]NOK67624.1 hypothetical protein [Chloroflexi bacterium AL-N10]NOK75606.1 hypothetical protein [Chloroflexi bacterium AL-N5]NOK82394.1 hypothetical protein [Chloroflexi bacterium AL-W]NOK90239.1 hypothetical protein [Chloroflexi bacterium AL-N15]
MAYYTCINPHSDAALDRYELFAIMPRCYANFNAVQPWHMDEWLGTMDVAAAQSYYAHTTTQNSLSPQFLA